MKRKKTKIGIFKTLSHNAPHKGLRKSFAHEKMSHSSKNVRAVAESF